METCLDWSDALDCLEEEYAPICGNIPHFQQRSSLELSAAASSAVEHCRWLMGSAPESTRYGTWYSRREVREREELLQALEWAQLEE